MSVINQVLKDLGERQSRSTISLANIVDRQPLRRQPSRNRNLLFRVSVVVLAGFVLIGLLVWQQKIPLPQRLQIAAVTRQSEPVTAPASVAVQQQAPVVNDVPVAAPIVAAEVVAVTAPDTRMQPVGTMATQAPVVAAAPVTIQPGESTQTAVATENTGIRRSATPVDQAEKYYRQGLEKLQSDRIDAAVSDLRKAVQLQPQMHAARELLSVLLLRSGYTVEAHDQLEQGMRMSPAYTAYARLYAQSLVEAGRPDEALRVLSASAAYAQQQPDYQAFMAALEQRLGAHEKSVQHYMAALALKPARSAWWVGMAISLEALGRMQDALRAYQTALSGTEINADLLQYARERVAQLGGAA